MQGVNVRTRAMSGSVTTKFTAFKEFPSAMDETIATIDPTKPFVNVRHVYLIGNFIIPHMTTASNGLAICSETEWSTQGYAAYTWPVVQLKHNTYDNN